MSDRIIRDELLTSERYCAVSDKAKLMFIHLLLNVDNLARYSGKNFTLRTACFPGEFIKPEALEKLLAELVEQDLVRVYMHGGDRYIFVPRFKQRLRYKSSSYPEPPNEINDLAVEKSDYSQSTDGLQSDHGQTTVRLQSAEVKRSEVKRSEETTSSGKPSSGLATEDVNELFEQFWTAYPKSKRKSGKSKCLAIWKAKKLDGQLPAILAHLKAVSDDYTKEDAKYCPSPQVYLNQMRWDGFDFSVHLSSTVSQLEDAL